ncbi:hypothetical protein PT974_08369 [Cladobotryum mycophilum]|uniref:NAD(P)-binding domain-containing protein n=1 Tax=Cladobotryum mycophilum TaxID=491253 RepID=A0ABR0SE85_9HYPO
MKVIVAGSTGFVGTEVIRQALSNPAITSVVGLARRQTALPNNLYPAADTSKFKSVVCDDFLNYPESVKQDLADADACIWLMAVTPNKSKSLPWEEVRKICHEYPILGIENIPKLPRKETATPFRFVYVSGSSAERDQTKKPWILGDYCLMRGKTETDILDIARNSGGAVEVVVAKPGLIRDSDTGYLKRGVQGVFTTLIGVPLIELDQISATLIKQATKGIEKETLVNEDLVKIGQEVLDQQKSS